MAALNLFFFAKRHAVVAQIIKTKFRIRAVSDIAIILFAPKFRRLVVQNHADTQTKKFINRAHPFRVT